MSSESFGSSLIVFVVYRLCEEFFNTEGTEEHGGHREHRELLTRRRQRGTEGTELFSY